VIPEEEGHNQRRRRWIPKRKTKRQSQKSQKGAMKNGNGCFNARKDHTEQQVQLVAGMH